MTSEFRIEKDSMGEIKVPKNSLYGAQTQRALNNFPISPSTEPEKIAIPSLFDVNSLKSQNGSLRPSLVKYDFDDNSIILLYPFTFSAKSGNKPTVFLNLKFIWVPIIGCVPTFDKFSANSSAPHKLEVSEIPTDWTLFSLQYGRFCYSIRHTLVAK